MWPLNNVCYGRLSIPMICFSVLPLPARQAIPRAVRSLDSGWMVACWLGAKARWDSDNCLLHYPVFAHNLAQKTLQKRVRQVKYHRDCPVRCGAGTGQGIDWQYHGAVTGVKFPRVRSETTLEFIDWFNIQDWTNIAKLKTNAPLVLLGRIDANWWAGRLYKRFGICAFVAPDIILEWLLWRLRP